MVLFVKKILFILVAACTLCACSNTRHLAAGEQLYTGSEVQITDKEAEKKVLKILKKDIGGLVRPVPNSKSMGLVRMKLTLYNMAGKKEKARGVRRWMRNKAGEPPVLASSVLLKTNKELIVNFLQNRGFFNASVAARMDTSGRRKMMAHYTITTGKQYKIKNAYLMADTASVIADIRQDFDKTLLHSGNAYNLDVIKAERERISRLLKEKGYYYFNADYLLVVADSAIGGNMVNMYVQLKKNGTPAEAYRKYVINDVYIFTNFKLKNNIQDTAKEGKIAYDNYYVIDKKKAYKPEVFTQAMVFEKGDLYSMDDQNASLSRLVNMGNFKFVKNRFEAIGDSLLDVYYYLTPYPNKSLRFEAGGLTQNDNRAGTRGSVSWRHRNAFRGVEELMMKVNGGFEGQYSGPVKQPNIYSIGVEVGLSVPKFILPFVDLYTPGRYLPRSMAKLKYNFESSAKLINISSYTATMGYNWREGARKEHQLFPINFTYVKTDTVGSPELAGISYGNLVYNGIILGPTYEFTYNSQSGAGHKHTVFFSGRIDLSGNILGLAQNADYSNNQQTIFGSPYAQYIKLQPDFRYYLRFSSSSVLATRLMAGIGMPYGNSIALPNIKQFWAGGNSDMRGFPSRLLGPGTFNEYDTATNRSYIQTLGDMKLELNIEWRQHIYKYFNFGVFADVGNIWLYRDNPMFPGGKFTPDFYKQLAAGVGAGLRIDLKILVLRLDMGMPVRKPWLPENSRWVVDKIAFADPDWKKKNLIFNIAIGYPF